MISTLVKGKYRYGILIGGRGPAMLTKSGQTTHGVPPNYQFNFVQSYWESGIDSMYTQFLSDSSYNTGQITILNDYQSDIFRYLSDNAPEYNPQDFIDFLQDNLGSEKFSALSETWEKFAEELLDLWDHSAGGDGFSKKKFLGVTYN